VETLLTSPSPIKTYGSRGTSKANTGHYQHAIIYTGVVPPAKLPSEAEFSKRAICVEPVNPAEALDPSSRINFGKPTPVEHNLRVRHVGMVQIHDIHKLLRYYEDETRTDYASEEENPGFSQPISPPPTVFQAGLESTYDSENDTVTGPNDFLEYTAIGHSYQRESRPETNEHSFLAPLRRGPSHHNNKSRSSRRG
jgi:hypothetical protein